MPSSPVLTLSLLVALSSAGCGAALTGRSAPAKASAAVFSGAECDELRPGSNVALRSDGRAADPPLPSWSPRHQVLLLVCNEAVAAADGARPDSVVTAHAAYDDRRGDALAAALLTVSCLRGESCYRRLVPEPDGTDPAESSMYHHRDAKAALGMLSFYATAASPAEVSAALEPLGLSPEARAAFVALFESAPARFADRIARFSPTEKHIFVDLPDRVRADRKAYFARRAELYRRLDALLATGGDDTTALVALRSDFVADCNEAACRFEPFYVELSQEIASRCTVAGDALCAHAESEVLAKSRANRESYGRAIYREQVLALEAANEAFERHAEARRNGLVRTVNDTSPGSLEPIDYSVGRLWHIGDEVPKVAALVSTEGLDFGSGVVKRVERRGDRAELVFETQSFVFDDPYDCVTTSRIERIHPDGTLEYAQRCKWRKRRSKGSVTAPISVPASEAAALVPGDLVAFVADAATREARLETATRDGHIVQQRGDRFRAAD